MKKQPKENRGDAVSAREQTRARILSAALKLLNAGGIDAVTTRAVAELAGVQPPILYRLFVDKSGLLNALAEHGFTLYLAQKQSQDADQDPVEALRSGWDRHIRFGIDHPSLYLLMYARLQAGSAPAAELSIAMLRRHISRVAGAGSLRIPEERAVALFHSAAVGIVLTLLRSDRDARDPGLSLMARDNTLSMIALTGTAPSDRSPVSSAATTLDAAIKIEDGFSQGEFGLLKEWLGRIKNLDCPTPCPANQLRSVEFVLDQPTSFTPDKS